MLKCNTKPLEKIIFNFKIFEYNVEHLIRMDLFKTERLSIRLLESSDLEPFYNMQSNSKVMQYVKPEMNLEER